MEKLLIVDDNAEISKQLKWGLGKDYSLLFAKNANEAVSIFKKNSPKVVTLDLGLPPHEDGAEEGLACLEAIIGRNSFTKIIVITGNDDRTNALRAIQLGAYDYYQKPIELAELKVIINRAFYLYSIENENRRLHHEMERRTSEMEGMVGQCPAMLEVFSTIRKIASSEVSVLIIGESGTGKELVARAIHSMSLRNDHPFIPINCGAIPENLLESELFGHEKGAFTGAQNQVQGKVEYADRGTLFLDEIGELTSNLQVKLLRFLQDKNIQRVGGREDIQVDTRIIAATNVDITEALKDGTFREDLYYRIGVITIKLPLLKERAEDIMLLANIFLHRFAQNFNKKIKGFAPQTIEMLRSYEWPGNVRELENKVQRAIIMCESSLIEPHDLGFAQAPMRKIDVDFETMTLKEVREKAERERIVHAIHKHDSNIARAAEELDVSRPTLYDLMKKHGLNY